MFESLEKENNIKIKLFGNWYIESTKLEFQICKYVLDKKSGEMVKNAIGHYSDITSLLTSLPNTYLKYESNATSIQELKDDIDYIKKVIEKFKNGD